MCLRSQTPLGELWHSPELPSWWGGGCKPPSQKLHPTFGLWLHIFTLWVWSCCPWGLADLLNDFWSLGELTPLMRIVRLWLRMSDVIDRTAVVKETSRRRSCTGMALMPRLLQVSASMTVNRDRHLTLLLSFLINSKCTKHQFIHLLTATFKDLHIENSNNLGDISYICRVIAHFISNSISIAMWVSRGKIWLAGFADPSLKTST